MLLCVTNMEKPHITYMHIQQPLLKAKNPEAGTVEHRSAHAIRGLPMTWMTDMSPCHALELTSQYCARWNLLASPFWVHIELVHTSNVPLHVVRPVELFGAEKAGKLSSHWPVQQLMTLKVGLVGKRMQADGAHNTFDR